MIPPNVVPTLPHYSKAAFKALTDADLWEPVEGGWHIRDAEERHDLEHVRQVRAARSEAGKRGAAARWQTDGKPMANAIANGWQTDGTFTSTATFTNVSKDPPPPKPVYASDEAAAFVSEVVRLVALRQLEHAPSVRNRSGWLAKARASIEDTWGLDVALRLGEWSVAQAVDHVEPPSPPKPDEPRSTVGWYDGCEPEKEAS